MFSVRPESLPERCGSLIKQAFRLHNNVAFVSSGPGSSAKLWLQCWSRLILSLWRCLPEISYYLHCPKYICSPVLVLLSSPVIFIWALRWYLYELSGDIYICFPVLFRSALRVIQISSPGYLDQLSGVTEISSPRICAFSGQTGELKWCIDRFYTIKREM